MVQVSDSKKYEPIFVPGNGSDPSTNGSNVFGNSEKKHGYSAQSHDFRVTFALNTTRIRMTY